MPYGDATDTPATGRYSKGNPLKRINDCIREARDHSAKWRTQAREDFDFYAGAQWSEEDLSRLKDLNRPAITFNRTAPIIDAVSGSEVNNRQEIRYLPREQGDVQVNEVLTGAAKWVRDQCDAEDEESEAFRDVLIAGMGWTETRLDYERDLDGDIVIQRIDPLEMYWDPAATKQNLSDARWIARIKKLTVEEFRAQWPDAPVAEGGEATPELENAADHLADEAWRYQNDQGGGEDRGKGVSVIEYQWMELEPAWRLVNPLTGKLETVDEKTWRRIAGAVQSNDIPFVKQQRRRFYRAFATASRLLEAGPLPVQDSGFTYKAICGKRDRNAATWFGLMRQMKDPQRWANKWLSQILHIMNSNAKGGVMVETPAVEDIRKFEESWASADAVTWLKPGGMGAVAPKPQTVPPVGFQQLTEFAISATRDATGVSLELLGLADRNQPGVLEYQRKQSGLTILAGLFNALRRYRKEQGRTLLEFIQKYISDERLIRVMGDNGQEQYIKLAKAETSQVYDVIVDEAPSSPNQREQVWQMLSQLLPQLIKLGVPTPPDLLDYVPLPSSLVAKWKQMITEQQQAAAQAQQQGGPQADPVAAAKAEALQADTQIKMADMQMRGQAHQMEMQAKQQEMGIKQATGAADAQAAQFRTVAAAADAQKKQIEAAVAPQVARQKLTLKPKGPQR